MHFSTWAQCCKSCLYSVEVKFRLRFFNLWYSSQILKHLGDFPLPQCWFGYYSHKSDPWFGLKSLVIPDPILLSPEPFPLSPDPGHILGFEPWAHIPCYDPVQYTKWCQSQKLQNKTVTSSAIFSDDANYGFPRWTPLGLEVCPRLIKSLL